MVGQSIATLVILVLFVGVLRMGVRGAVWGSVIISCLGAVAVLLAIRHVSIRHPEGAPASTRSLVSYGVRAYPAGITGYFSYRADVFLIQALLLRSDGPLGLYSMAVTMAELIFYIPDAVTTIFLPTVAGSTAEAADAKLGRVSRLTMLVTVSCAVALVPAAWVGLHLVLPQFIDCMPAFLVLLPGVVSLSLGKVMTSYIAGRGRPGPISVGAALTLGLNLVANVILIPQYGIVGASLSSLVSYTVMAVLMVAVACRISGLSPFALIVPRKEEFLVLRRVALQAFARLASKVGA
jgi:O-antigen/teichoic acid export membrane protein